MERLGKSFIEDLLMIKKILITDFILILSINLYSNKPFVLIYPTSPKKGETIFLDIVSLPQTKIIIDSFSNMEIKPIKISDSHKLAMIPVDIEYPKDEITFTIEIENQEKYSYSVKLEEPVVRERNLIVKRKKIKTILSESEKKELLREAILVSKARKVFTENLYINGSFIYPVKEIRNQDLYFGDLRKIIFGDGEKKQYHRGIDFGAPWGTKVYAPNNGRVIIADNFKTRGKTIIIDHGYGILTEYLHLSIIRVRKGQYVKKGQLIGNIGSTGFSTGPHLHWSFLVNGVLVNPLQWTTPIIAEIFKNGFNILGLKD